MNRTFLLTLLLVSGILFAQEKYLPEQRTYNSSDNGYTQYNTPSLYQTNQYVLTFDDGPHVTRTPQILDSLKKYNIKATFFIITSRINSQTAPLVKRMIDEGHIVANHGEDHFNSNQITQEEFKTNILNGFKTLHSTLKKYNIELDKFYYRFPYAAYGLHTNYHHLNALKDLSDYLFGQNCIHFVFWDHDTADWVPGMNQNDLIQNIKAFDQGGEFVTYKLETINGKREIIKIKKDDYLATQGGVILFHDIQANTANSLNAVLEQFKMQKSQIINLSEVDEYSARDFKNCKLSF